MILRPAKHKLLLSFSPEYAERHERLSLRLKGLRNLRNSTVRELVVRCYPFVVPLQVLIYVYVSKEIALITTLSYGLGVLLFFAITEIIYTVKENDYGL
jgi:hypothetical protein